MHPGWFAAAVAYRLPSERKFLGRELYALRKSGGFRFHLCHAVEYAAERLSQSICDAVTPCVVKGSGFKVMSATSTI